MKLRAQCFEAPGIGDEAEPIIFERRKDDAFLPVGPWRLQDNGPAERGLAPQYPPVAHGTGCALPFERTRSVFFEMMLHAIRQPRPHASVLTRLISAAKPIEPGGRMCGKLAPHPPTQTAQRAQHTAVVQRLHDAGTGDEQGPGDHCL